MTKGLMSTCVKEKSRKIFASYEAEGSSPVGKVFKDGNRPVARDRQAGGDRRVPGGDGSRAPKRVTRQRTRTCPEGRVGDWALCGLAPVPGAASCRYFELEADGSCGCVLPAVTGVGGGSPCGRNSPVGRGSRGAQCLPTEGGPAPGWSMEGEVGAGGGGPRGRALEGGGGSGTESRSPGRGGEARSRVCSLGSCI